ncbi:DUF6726 family protein [Inquilinus sp. CA228]|uniref:DUF6726 family protein n=1 Tax=Inquilinus sp. CA228 TaxID=3455609 RepID=UPI003F8D150C
MTVDGFRSDPANPSDGSALALRPRWPAGDPESMIDKPAMGEEEPMPRTGMRQGLHQWSAHRGGHARFPVLLLIAATCFGLAGCGAVAFPFRVVADTAKIVPVVGDAVAAPLDAAGDAID